MKRSTAASILGCILCFLLTSLVFAQTSPKTQSGAKAKSTAPAKTKAKVSPGQNKFRLFNSVDKIKPPISASLDADRTGDCPGPPDRVPEVVYLSLTDAQYNDFLHDPKGFVNNYKLFTCPITGPMRRLTKAATKTAVKKAAPGGDPMLAVVHDPDCGGYWYDVPEYP